MSSPLPQADGKKRWYRHLGPWLLMAGLYEHDVKLAPVVYEGPWEPDLVLPLAENDSTIVGAPKGHMREGIVIVPSPERRDPRHGRVALKHISDRYWLL